MEHRVARCERRRRSFRHELADRSHHAHHSRGERPRPVVQAAHPHASARPDTERRRDVVADEQLVGSVGAGQSTTDDDRVTGPRRVVRPVDLDQGRHPEPAVGGRSEPHHAPRRPGGITDLRHRADDAELGTRNVRRALVHLVGCPRLHSHRAEVEQHVRRVSVGDELIDGDGGASPGGPRRHRQRGTEAGDEGEHDRRDAVARTSAPVRIRAASLNIDVIVPRSSRGRPSWSHVMPMV